MYYFYLLSIFLSVALVSAQKRHIYLGTRSLFVPATAGGTVEYLSADGPINLISHGAVLVGENGRKSPHWKPDSTKPLGTLFELNNDEQWNTRAIKTRHFRPRQMDRWSFKHLGTT
jgi:hypothetical protein